MAVVNISGEDLLLLPEKAIFWQRKNILLLADLHLGKSGHFRKAGIAVPSGVHEEDLSRLAILLSRLPVEKVYLLGDLFHSSHNSQWEQFMRWRNGFEKIEFHLIKGNHDILEETLFTDAGMTVHREQLADDPFLFSHQHVKLKSGSPYLLSGHIHPGVRLDGKGLQSVSLPCFWFGEKEAVLPAFGNFTGHSRIDPMKNDRVFLIYSDKVELMKG
jgi:DNA ligase-associated metallophosphoesterase